MKRDFERIAVFFVGVYLLMQDKLENKNNYEIFKSTYVEDEKKSEMDYMFDYYITNPQRWKRKIKSIISMLTVDVLRQIFNEIMDLYHKIFKK